MCELVKGCCVVWCHHCGHVCSPADWVKGEAFGGLNSCPACGDFYPSGFCLCELLDAPTDAELGTAIAERGHDRIPA